MNFIQQAYKGKNDWWRYLITLIYIMIGWQLIGVLPLFFVAFSKVDNFNDLLLASGDAFSSLGINSSFYLFLIILSFLLGLIALFFGVKYVHLRKINTLITARKTTDWHRVIYGFFFWFLLSLATIAIDYFFNAEHYVWNFKPIPFVILLIVSFLFLPFQTSFEELLFRGYFMQGLGILFKNAIYPLVITSIVFGMLHGFNPEFDKLGPLVMIYYIGTGFLFGIITLLDDGTELALGMHAANNIAASVFVTMNWTAFQTDALFVDISEPSLGLEMYFPVFVIYPLTVLWFSKKYGWKNWKKKLLENIENQSNSIT